MKQILTKNINLVTKVLFVMMVPLMMMAACTKEEKADPAPAPPPAPGVPTPVFTVTAEPISVTELYLYVICQSHDYEPVKLVAKTPLGQSVPFNVSDYGTLIIGQSMDFIAQRLSGTWIFTIDGRFAGGEHAGKGFKSTATLQVSAKK